jgi:hypothetical protein
MAIIGISGKMQSGKSTVAKVIQYLISESKVLNKDQFPLSFEDFLQNEESNNDGAWEIHSFADALKDIVCILTGCTRKQLEDINFKNSKLPDEWIRYGYADGFFKYYKNGKEEIKMNNRQCSKERYELEVRTNWETAYKVHPTYREILQYIGTDLFRNKLHENVWINAIFSKYKPEYKYNDNSKATVDSWHHTSLPNWIISDVRFLNEIEAIKDRGGIIIRCDRDLDYANYLSKYNDTSIMTYDDLDSNQNMLSLAHFRREDRPTSFKDKWYSNKFEHVSETELDTYAFDYTIDNNGTMEELIEQVKEILINENLL